MQSTEGSVLPLEDAEKQMRILQLMHKLWMLPSWLEVLNSAFQFSWKS